MVVVVNEAETIFGGGLIIVGRMFICCTCSFQLVTLSSWFLVPEVEWYLDMVAFREEESWWNL